MNEWSIFLIVAELVAFVGIFVKIAHSYSTNIAKLTITLENLQKCIEDMEKSKKATHARIFGILEEHDDQLNDHECRIKILEEDKK